MITQETYRCWVIGRLPGDTEPHFKTRKAAAGRLRELRKSDEDRTAEAAVRRLGAPCWTIQCDGECGYVIDEDEDCLIHFTDAGDAMRTIRDWQWRLVDHEHVLCPADVLPSPSPAEQEAAGQLVLPGVVP